MSSSQLRILNTRQNSRHRSSDPRLPYLEQYGHDSLSYSSLQDGLDCYLRLGCGYIPFMRVKQKSETVVCLADPICSHKDKRAFLEGFVKIFKDPIFLHISKNTAQILQNLGFTINELGHETIIDVQQFGLAGNKKEFLRSQCNRAKKDGVRVVELDERTVSARSLAAISDEWQKHKVVRHGELSFITRPMVYDDEPGVRKFYALKDGLITGFVVFDPIYSEGRRIGYLANILRAGRKASYSVTDFIIAEALKKFKAEGVKTLSLGLSPFCAIDDHSEFRYSKFLKLFFRFLFNNANYIYNFKELAFHKKRYRPGTDGTLEVKVYCATRGVFPLWRIYAIFCAMGFRPFRQTMEHGLHLLKVAIVGPEQSRKYSIVKRRLIGMVFAFLLMLNFAVPVEMARANAGIAGDSYVTTDGVTLHYIDGGAGRAVVLLHGNDGTLQDFRFSIFDRLSRKYRVLAFDRPGHGESTLPEHVSATPELQALILHNALIKLGVVHPLVVAHSWSGALALSYALQFPNETSGLVIMGGEVFDTRAVKPKLSYHVAGIPGVGSIITGLYKHTGKKEFEKELDLAFTPRVAPEQYKRQFMANLLRTSQLKAAASDEITIYECMKRMRPYYGTIKVPIVIVVGDLDKTVSPAQQSFRLHRVIPQSTLLILHHAGHELQFGKPEEVVAAIDLADKQSELQAKQSTLATHGHTATKPLPAAQ